MPKALTRIVFDLLEYVQRHIFISSLIIIKVARDFKEGLHPNLAT